MLLTNTYTDNPYIESESRLKASLKEGNQHIDYKIKPIIRKRHSPESIIKLLHKIKISGEMEGIREQVSIQFTGSSQERDKNFGEFCVELTEAHIQFNIVGNRTIIMYREIVEFLYGKPQKLYEKYLNKKQIQVESVTATGKRLRKSREEAKQRARWYMQNR